MRDVIGRSEYAPLREDFKQYLSKLGQGFTWYQGYHYIDCPIHPKADAVVRHEDHTYHCGVCVWNNWICR